MSPRAMGLVLALAFVTGSAACASPATSPSNTIRVSRQQLGVTRILAFGDSLTEGADGDTIFPPVDPSTPGPPHSYPYKLRALLADRYRSQTISVFNGGVGGATAAGSQPRLASLMSQFNPDLVILLCGVNDLNAGFSIDATAASMGALIAEVRARGKVLILSTITRQRPGGRRAFSVPLVLPYNAVLVHLSETSGAPLADIYPLISEDLLAPDGLHLSESANFVLASAYADVVRLNFESTLGVATSLDRR